MPNQYYDLSLDELMRRVDGFSLKCAMSRLGVPKELINTAITDSSVDSETLIDHLAVNNVPENKIREMIARENGPD